MRNSHVFSKNNYKIIFHHHFTLPKTYPLTLCAKFLILKKVTLVSIPFKFLFQDKAAKLQTNGCQQKLSQET